MELETAFYIIAIVFMSLMLILIAALLVVVLVIRAKINRFQNMLEDRVDQAKSAAGKAAIGLKTLRYFIKK